ncbi:MAG: hypothetical protein AB1597_01375 [Chloroflexota bacterium]
MTMGARTEGKRVAIILHSEAYDRVSYALSLAQVALASGMEVYVLLTYGALGRFVGNRLMQMGDETSPLTKERIQRGLATGGIQTLETQLADARVLGLKIYACPNAMAALNIARSDLRSEVDGTMGLATFLPLASDATINWYI